jgi:hypothetical protein
MMAARITSAMVTPLSPFCRVDDTFWHFACPTDGVYKSITRQCRESGYLIGVAALSALIRLFDHQQLLFDPQQFATVSCRLLSAATLCRSKVKRMQQVTCGKW